MGQGRGLAIATGEPLYVIATEPESQRVVVGRNEELYRGEAAAATLEPAGDPARVVVRFDEPQRAVTPGQAAVFYDGDLVLGGGWIE